MRARPRLGFLSRLSRRALTVTAACLSLAALAPATSAATDPVIAAAGDIACDPGVSGFNGGAGVATRCRQMFASNLLVNTGLSAVLPLGDTQYACGGYSAFTASYAPSWGRLRSISRPAIGNHEYLTTGGTGCDSANTGAAGYFKYFGAAAGAPSKAYY